MSGYHREEGGKGALATLLFCLLICAVGAAAYYNALGGEFVYDDKLSMLWQPGVKSLDLGELWRSFDVRSLGYLTFALNYKLTGFDPFWFHVVNVVIHLISSCLVFWLARMVIQRSADLGASRVGIKYSNAVALTAALIFVSHPIETQAVTFVIQRLASLAALLYLLSMALFFKGRLMIDTGHRSGIALISLSVASAIAAMFVKQNAFTIPLALLLIEFAFFSPSLRLMKRKVALFVVAIVLMAVIPVALLISHGVSLEEIADISRTTRILGRYEYFVTQINVVRTYLRLIFYPVGQRLDYAYPLFHSILNERTVLSAILHAGLVVAAIASFKRKRAVFFGIALFYITLIVEASVFPISDVIVEHRVYLPSVGIFIAASSLIWLAAKRLHARRVSVWILVGALIALLTFMTHQRNGAWADSETIWGDNIAKEPTSFRAHYNLGKEYEYQKRWDEAKREWREAVKYRDSAWAWNNIANILLMEENHDEALKAFRKAIELNPTFAAPYANMGVIREKQGRYDESIELNRKAISIDPEFGKAYFNIGRAYIAKKNFVSAERALARAIELDPKNADVRFHMAIVMFRTGRGTEAVDQLREVIRISPDHRPSRNLMRELTKKGGGG